MAVPVRPPVWPQAQVDAQATHIQPGRNDARVAAQKAFFEAALTGKAAAAASIEAEPIRAAASATPLQATHAAAQIEARAADRLPPPGSLVDILV